MTVRDTPWLIQRLERSSSITLSESRCGLGNRGETPTSVASASNGRLFSKPGVQGVATPSRKEWCDRGFSWTGRKSRYVTWGKNLAGHPMCFQWRVTTVCFELGYSFTTRENNLVFFSVLKGKIIDHGMSEYMPRFPAPLG